MADIISQKFERAIKPLIDKYGLGNICAEMLMLSADLIAESDDPAFRTEAIKRFANRAENFQDNHLIERKASSDDIQSASIG